MIRSKYTKRFVNQLQQYIKIDTAYVLRGGFWLLVNQVVSALAGFVSVYLLANYFLPEQYGQYTYVFTVFSLFGVATLSGMHSSLVRSVSQNKTKTILKIIQTRVKWGIVGTVFCFLLGLYYFYANNNLLGIIFVSLSPLVPFHFGYDIFQSFLIGKKDYKRLATFSIYIRIVSLLVLLLVLLFTKSVLFVVLSSVVVVSFLRWLATKKSIQTYEPLNGVDPGAVNYGKQLSALGIVTMLAGNLDKILLFQLVDAKSVAMYTVATIFVFKIKDVFKIIETLSLPKFGEHKPIDLVNSLTYKIVLLTSIIIPVVILYNIAAPYLFKVFFPDYIFAIPYTRIFSLFLLTIPKMLINSALVVMKEIKILSIIRTVSPLIMIALMFVLISLYDVHGAVLAFLLGHVFSYMLMLTLFFVVKKGLNSGSSNLSVL